MGSKNAVIAVVMGSKSDQAAMVECKKYFKHFNISYDEFIMSAHRNPHETAEFATTAADKGYKVIIGVAGMAAHLAGVIAGHTILPVIGVPMPGSHLNGVDALYATVQMPKGVPVATVAIGTAGAANAAVLATQILALSDVTLREKLVEFKKIGCRI